MTKKRDSKTIRQIEFENWIKLEYPSHSIETRSTDKVEYKSAGTQHKWLGYNAGIERIMQ